VAHKNHSALVSNNEMAAMRHFFNSDYKTISNREINTINGISRVNLF
jgi:hypothetical protein